MVAPKKAATRPAKKTSSTRSSSATGSATTTALRDDTSAWTKAELAAVRDELAAQTAKLTTEIAQAEAEFVELMRDPGDGAGDDQADAGAKTYEREQEMTLANNSREILEQNLRALERIDEGIYGICENCGEPIGKLRLQAAPRATLCMTCKTKQERR